MDGLSCAYLPLLNKSIGPFNILPQRVNKGAFLCALMAKKKKKGAHRQFGQLSQHVS
jgi:hypothetical protein